MTKKVNLYKKNNRYIKKYLEISRVWSQLSYAKNKKVGCIIVKDSVIISDGYNGTPAGLENECEDNNGNTKWYVIHAEENAILKLCKIGNSAKDSVIFTTLSPCKNCSKMILQAGIKSVYYQEAYKDTSGIQFLEESGIKCFQIVK